MPQLTPLGKAYFHDAGFHAEAEEWTYNPPCIEPGMFYFGPYVGSDV